MSRFFEKSTVGAVLSAEGGSKAGGESARWVLLLACVVGRLGAGITACCGGGCQAHRDLDQAAAPPAPGAEVEAKFAAFKARFQRTYASTQEEAARACG